MAEFGTYNRPLLYEAPLPGTADSFGATDPQFADGVVIWAKVRTPTGRELFHAEQIQALADHVLETRYPGYAFDPKGRFVFGARVFNISWVNDIHEGNRELWVYCVEVTSPVGT